MTCQSCVYWRQVPESPTVGACRRYPPQLALTQGTLLVTAQWPLTAQAEWCGEHIQQEETQMFMTNRDLSMANQDDEA